MSFSFRSSSNLHAYYLYFVILLQISGHVHGGPLASPLNELNLVLTNFLNDVWCDNVDFGNSFFCPQTEDPDDLCLQVTPLPADEFIFEEFVAKSWYVQRQQENAMQDQNERYCVVTTYGENFWGHILVKNYGNYGAINENPFGTNEYNTGILGGLASVDFFGLYAQHLSGGEFSVGLGFLGVQFWMRATQPYWVVAIADDYEWAVISGGQPDKILATEPTYLCTTQYEGDQFYDVTGGLWILTRKQVVLESDLVEAYAKIQELGIYSGNMLNVEHVGCNYEGVTIK